jgi:hypothetical protein
MGWVVNAMPQPRYTWERDPVTIIQEARWALGPVWTDRENFAATEVRTADCAVCSELF